MHNKQTQNSVGQLSFVLFVKTEDANQQDSAPAHVTFVCVCVCMCVCVSACVTI